MKFHKNLYVGDTVRKLAKVKWKLRHNAGQLNVYVIAIPDGHDQLEFYHCAYLQQKYYQKYSPYIVGIANGRNEALAVVEKIVVECLEVTGTCAIKEYLLMEYNNVSSFHDL